MNATTVATTTTHTRRCLAHAMICAVESMRDGLVNDGDFRAMAEWNTQLGWADRYLANGDTTCLCTA